MKEIRLSDGSTRGVNFIRSELTDEAEVAKGDTDSGSGFAAENILIK